MSKYGKEDFGCWGINENCNSKQLCTHGFYRQLVFFIKLIPSKLQTSKELSLHSSKGLVQKSRRERGEQRLTCTVNGICFSMGKWHGTTTSMSNLNAMNGSSNNDRLEICTEKCYFSVTNLYR